MTTEIDGWVYFARAVGTAYRKIGFTTNLEQRLNVLQVGNMYELKYETVWPCHHVSEAEKALHKHFKSSWVRGEWFSLPNLDATVIPTILKPYYLPKYEDLSPLTTAGDEDAQWFRAAAAVDERAMRGTKRQRVDRHQSSLKELDALYKRRIGDSTYYDLGPVLRNVGAKQARAKVAKLLMGEEGNKEVVAQRLGTVDGLLENLKAQVLASGKKWNKSGKEQMIVCSEANLPYAILMIVIFSAKGKRLFNQVKPIISAASLMHHDPEAYAKQMAKFFNF